MRPSAWNLIWMAVVLALAASPFMLLALITSPGDGPAVPPIALNELALAVKRSTIRSIVVDGSQGVATDIFGEEFTFQVGPTTKALHALSAFGVSPEDLSNLTYIVQDPPPFGDW